MRNVEIRTLELKALKEVGMPRGQTINHKGLGRSRALPLITSYIRLRISKCRALPLHV